MATDLDGSAVAIKFMNNLAQFKIEVKSQDLGLGFRIRIRIRVRVT